MNQYKNDTDATKPCRNHPHHCPVCGKEIECGYVCCPSCAPPSWYESPRIAAARDALVAAALAWAEADADPGRPRSFVILNEARTTLHAAVTAYREATT